MVRWSMKLRVECYAGHKADQRPVKFWLGNALHFIESIDEQWYGPEASYLLCSWPVHSRSTRKLNLQRRRNTWLPPARWRMSPVSITPFLSKRFVSNPNLPALVGAAAVGSEPKVDNGPAVNSPQSGAV